MNSKCFQTDSKYMGILGVIVIFPQTVLALMRFWRVDKAARSCHAAPRLGNHQKCYQSLGNINIGENKVAVAAAGWSPHQRRCSHSNFIFGKPYKTNAILILFWSKSRFPYKS